MAKKPFAKIPCHAVSIPGSPEAAKRMPSGGSDPQTGCLAVTSRRRMGVRLDDPKPELRAESTGKPCMTKRRSCPVQLVFKNGLPYMRLCKRAGNKKPGYLIPAGTPAQATARAAELCTCWRANGKKFENCGVDRGRLGRSR